MHGMLALAGLASGKSGSSKVFGQIWWISAQMHRHISKMCASQCLRPVAFSAHLAPSHASYRGPELVWATD